MIVSHPNNIFKSNDLATLPKETLIALLKNDELNMDEDDVWMSVIQWGTKQVPELELGSDPDAWSSSDMNKVKDIIAGCIPLIRFSTISLDKIIQYNDLLPRKLRRDLLNYHTAKNYKQDIHMLPPRTGQACMPSPNGYDIDSVIINKKQAEWISSKIVESTRQHQKTSMNQDDFYKFTLLYRRSRDGDTVRKFRELCNNKGPTISVGKVLGTEEILGGYNPLAWGFRGNANFDHNTKESFIFTLDGNIGNNIVSFVTNSGSGAIGDYYTYYPMFGHGRDLCFGDGTSQKPFAKKNSYQVLIRQSSDYFEWFDWEVFLVTSL